MNKNILFEYTLKPTLCAAVPCSRAIYVHDRTAYLLGALRALHGRVRVATLLHSWSSDMGHIYIYVLIYLGQEPLPPRTCMFDTMFSGRSDTPHVFSMQWPLAASFSTSLNKKTKDLKYPSPLPQVWGLESQISTLSHQNPLKSYPPRNITFS